MRRPRTLTRRGTGPCVLRSAPARRLAWQNRRCIFVREAESMTSTTTATGDGLGSPLDMLWSADRVARLLALAEQANRCDGWLTADDLGRLSLDEPREDHGEKWRTAIARLGEQFTNLQIFVADSPDYPEFAVGNSSCSSGPVRPRLAGQQRRGLCRNGRKP